MHDQTLPLTSIAMLPASTKKTYWKLYQNTKKSALSPTHSKHSHNEEYTVIYTQYYYITLKKKPRGIVPLGLFSVRQFIGHNFKFLAFVR